MREPRVRGPRTELWGAGQQDVQRDCPSLHTLSPATALGSVSRTWHLHKPILFPLMGIQGWAKGHRDAPVPCPLLHHFMSESPGDPPRSLTLQTEGRGAGECAIWGDSAAAQAAPGHWGGCSWSPQLGRRWMCVQHLPGQQAKQTHFGSISRLSLTQCSSGSVCT